MVPRPQNLAQLHEGGGIVKSAAQILEDATAKESLIAKGWTYVTCPACKGTGADPYSGMSCRGCHIYKCDENHGYWVAPRKPLESKIAKPTYEQILVLLEEIQGHLEYIGWGDSWERECAGDLPSRLDKTIEEIKKP